jgi:DNA modification methylase
MSRQCITCGIEIDPRRIAILPHTQTCTQHSTAEKKVAVIVQMGEGDHTWIETYAVDRADYDKMRELDSSNRLEYNSNGVPRVKKYLHEMEGIPVRDLWLDINQIQGNEKLDYATQKPVKLLERIINMFSNKGDLVLDPFAGSGTTARACLNTNRDYVMLDINIKGKEIFEKSLIKNEGTNI